MDSISECNLLGARMTLFPSFSPDWPLNAEGEPEADKMVPSVKGSSRFPAAWPTSPTVSSARHAGPAPERRPEPGPKFIRDRITGPVIASDHRPRPPRARTGPDQRAY